MFDVKYKKTKYTIVYKFLNITFCFDFITFNKNKNYF